MQFAPKQLFSGILDIFIVSLIQQTFIKRLQWSQGQWSQGLKIWIGGEGSRQNKLIDEISHLLVFSGFLWVTKEMFPATQTLFWVQALRKRKAIPDIQELAWHSQVVLVFCWTYPLPPNYLTQTQILNVLSNTLVLRCPVIPHGSHPLLCYKKVINLACPTTGVFLMVFGWKAFKLPMFTSYVILDQQFHLQKPPFLHLFNGELCFYSKWLLWGYRAGLTLSDFSVYF